jgi:hypothetical protein
MTKLRGVAWARIGGGLDHLDHEGRSAAREIVRCADAAEQPVDRGPVWPRSGGDEGAGLGEDG